jgi:hypothetical protein
MAKKNPSPAASLALSVLLSIAVVLSFASAFAGRGEVGVWCRSGQDECTAKISYCVDPNPSSGLSCPGGKPADVKVDR